MKSFCLSCLILLSATIYGQGDGMLWRITGNGLKKPSYLFGTIHIYCNHDNIRKAAISSAIDSSDIVAMELNLNDFSTFVAIMKSSMKPSGKSLKAMLPEKDYHLVDSVCLAMTGNPLENFDNKSPMTVLSSLIVSEQVTGCQGALPVDMTIAEMAKKSGKISHGLETFEFQDSLLSAIPDTTQLRWLLEFCRNPEQSKSEIKMMLAAYDSHESARLYDIIFKTSPEMAMFSDVLLVRRNIAWVNFLRDNMDNNVYFMAVGAGHLGGNDGLINLLRKSGYTVSPVNIK